MRRVRDYYEAESKSLRRVEQGGAPRRNLTERVRRERGKDREPPDNENEAKAQRGSHLRRFSLGEDRKRKKTLRYLEKRGKSPRERMKPKASY